MNIPPFKLPSNVAILGAFRLCLFLSIQTIGTAQTEIDGNDIGQSVSVGKDGSAYMVGHFESDNGSFRGMSHGQRDVFVAKYAPSGKKAWQKVFGGTQTDFANNSLSNFVDGNLIALVNSESTDGDFDRSNGGQDIWVLKLSPEGELVWKKNFGGSGWDFGTFATDTRDGGFLFAGITKSEDGDFKGFDSAGGTGFVVKCASNGAIQWVRQFAGNGYDEIFSCIETREGDFVALLKTTSKDIKLASQAVDCSMCAYLLGPDGKTKKGVGLTDTGYVYARNCCQAQDGGFFLAGHAVIQDSTNTLPHEYFWMAKLDKDLNPVWERFLPAKRHGLFEQLCPYPDNSGYLLCGVDLTRTLDPKKNETWPSTPLKDALLAKVDLSGKLVWAKYFGGAGSDIFYQAQFLPDGSAVAVGSTSSTNGDLNGRRNNSIDAWAVRVDPEGNLLWSNLLGGWIEEQVVGHSEKALRIPMGMSEPVFIQLADFGLGVLTALLACLLTVFLRNKRLAREQLQELRSHISQDLHDEIGSSIGSIALFGKSLQNMLGDARPDASAGLAHITRNAETSLEALRDIVWIIDSRHDTAEDFTARAHELVEANCSAAGIACEIGADLKYPAQRLHPALKKNLWLILKEAVANALRYSETDRLVVKIAIDRHSVSLKIQDLGTGFDPKNGRPAGNGLKNMALRAAEIRGTLDIESGPGRGTTVFLKCPAGGE